MELIKILVVLSLLVITTMPLSASEKKTVLVKTRSVSWKPAEPVADKTPQYDSKTLDRALKKLPSGYMGNDVEGLYE